MFSNIVAVGNENWTRKYNLWGLWVQSFHMDELPAIEKPPTRRDRNFDFGVSTP
jgi:hypothetical protein